ncbi:MAG: hypothetical protein ABH825_01095, partial [Candidatus Omnitrophota bacterium]
MVSSKGPSVFLLLGEEDFLKQQQLDFLKNKFFEVNKASQVDFHIFNSRQTDLSGIIDTASTYSFLAGRRL